LLGFPGTFRLNATVPAIGSTRVRPVEVTTDRAPVYPAVLEALLPAAWHRTEQYANNGIECDHGRLKERLVARQS
jgi:transposase-like protein